MTKKQVLTSVLVAGFALSSGGAAFADEVQSQSVQPQTSAATVVSQPAADNSTPTVPDSGQASNSDTQPAGGDVSQPSSSTPSSSDTGSSSSQPSEQPSQDNSAPASSDSPSVPDSGQSSQPSSGDQGTTAPSGDNSGASTPESSTPSSSAPSPSEPSNSTPEASTPSSSTDNKGNQPQAAPDQSTPDVSDSNQDVTPEAPVTTENGSTIVSVQNGQPIVSQSDGSTQAVDPGSVGATVNSDKTLSVKGDDGKMKTLPNTGDGASSAVMASGLGMVLSAVLLFMQSKFKLFTKKD